MIYRNHDHLDVAYSDAVGSRSYRCSTIGYYTFVGVNLVFWRSKKQNIVSQISVKAEYRIMAHTVGN